jgi:hypothetical protein
MYELGVACLSLAVMVGCFWGGLVIQRFLREHHLNQSSVDSLRMILSLLVTFAALVLGMLLTSTHTRFANLEAGIRGLGVDITEVDQRLRAYGPELDPLRADLIRYTEAAIADTWPGEPAPPGDYPRHLQAIGPGSVESVQLGDILDHIDLAIRRLAPQDDFHRSLAASLEARMHDLQAQRWDLIENSLPTLPWPFVVLLIFWMAVIFGIAGVNSPSNILIHAVMILAAVSLASSVFLTLDLDTPFSGFIKVYSTPLRDALLHVTAPPLPAGAP